MPLLMCCEPARGGIATDCLREITHDAAYFSISVVRLGKPRPVIFQSDCRAEISRIIRSFDFIDPDVSDLGPGEYSVTHCLCISEYRLEVDLADGSRLMIDVVGEISGVEVSVSLHPQHFGSLSLSDEGKVRVRETLKGLRGRSSALRQRRWSPPKFGKPAFNLSSLRRALRVSFGKTGHGPSHSSYHSSI